jgi:hypothetical protein
MSDRYDLRQMLKEAEQDQKTVRHAVITIDREQIRKLVSARRERKEERSA